MIQLELANGFKFLGFNKDEYKTFCSDMASLNKLSDSDFYKKYNVLNTKCILTGDVTDVNDSDTKNILDVVMPYNNNGERLQNGKSFKCFCGLNNDDILVHSNAIDAWECLILSNPCKYAAVFAVDRK